MKATRRSALKFMAGGAAALATSRSGFAQAKPGLAIHPGPFQGTAESLSQYTVPEWYRDAKFGIWSHWGPQSGIERGDWYARYMYVQTSGQFQYQCDTYGHPSKVGYKDLCPLWKAADWDPEHLMDLYRKAGAKYFVSMGVHHDNFDLWNSKYNRWNAVKVGPHRDVVGLWKKAAVARGLKFGVSEHLSVSYKWFGVAHGADLAGPLQDVPYDGHDPRYFDLYHEAATAQWAHGDFGWNDVGIPEAWKRHWFMRIRDLVDNYQPDLLYSDSRLPFEAYGHAAVANLYNTSARLHHGKNQAIYTCKNEQDCAVGTCVLDFESGLANKIRTLPWQTDTCIGGWHYSRQRFEKHKYKTTKTVIDLLVDIVSQNGNLLLNIPLPNNGVPDSDEMKILEGITAWMKVNSEGIYGTRPWTIYGEGPGMPVASSKPGAAFNERNRKELTAEDIRFTTKGPTTLYAFVMGWPKSEAIIGALGTASPQAPAKVQNVELLGYDGKLSFQQEAKGLRVRLPEKAPSDYGVTLKITL
jgi:alpha-L-fucosidase